MLFLREIGPASNRFPGGELLAQLFELCHGAFISVIAKKKMVWRVRGLDRLEDGLCGANRVTRLLTGGFARLLAPRARCRRVILNVPLAFVRRTSGPIGAEATRLNDDHLDAQRFHLLAECPGQTFHRKFRRVVIAERGK